MWLTDQNDENLVDQASSSFKLMHWHCLGDGPKTEFRVSTASARRIAKSMKSVAILNKDVPRSTSSICPAVVVDTEDSYMAHKDLNDCDNSNFQEEKNVLCQYHIDDHKLYPGKYKLWRYNFQEKSSMKTKTYDNIISCTNNWVPYFLLSDIQKELVDWKYASFMDIVAWTCWPGAVVDCET